MKVISTNPLVIETRGNGGAPYLWRLSDGDGGGLLVRMEDAISVLPNADNAVQICPRNV